ncbi:ABC transporter permease [Citrobacter freundii]|nr:ABC transporter permease [Citrobacter freundii]
MISRYWCATTIAGISPCSKTTVESDFGGPLATQADYQGSVVTAAPGNQGWILWAPIRFGATSINFATDKPFPSPPSAQNWLGTDANGGDVLARVLYGTRISVLFGLMLTLCSSVMGIMAGAIQGYYGGKVDLWGQRFIEVWSGMPTLFLIILLSSVVQPNFWWLLGITVLFGWMSLVGVVRAEFLRTRNFDYIRAAQALGVSDRSIILRHMLPNAMVAALTFLPFILCASITTLTSLDFLGFGLPLGSPSLGELLLQGKNNLQAPWLGITAFISVALLLSLLIFIGEAVRDAFDPNKAI